MALVAYGSSDESGSGSDYEDEPSVPTLAKSVPTAPNQPPQIDDAAIDDHTSATFAFNLPQPRTAAASSSNSGGAGSTIVEEDDEFLHKKATVFPLERPPPPPKPLPKAAAGPVRIVLPALATFSEHKQKEKPPIGAQLPSNRPAGLLNMLPKPKSMQFGQKTSTATGKASSALVPDSISRPKKPPIAAAPIRRAAVPKKAAAVAAAQSDSEDSDAEDFFALNADEQLPEVSAAEIAALVASKSARMGQAAKELRLQEENGQVAAAATAAANEPQPSAAQSGNGRGQGMDQQAIAALIGQRRAKKRSAADEMSNIIDISGDQVLPDRDAWLRQQLTATTEYQPRGLVDGDPGAGTKRKHQITYLAHQAKVNEQELQAMWSANRQTRQQTQNKYGF